jgi:hypothetical protein
MLVDGVTVEYRRPDGSIAGAQARVLDFDDPDNNDWLAVNQFTVVENRHTRRPDVVLFVNGLPLAVIELKNPPMSRPPSGPPTSSSRPTSRRFPRSSPTTRPGHLGRAGGAHRHAHRRPRPVHALADDHW